MVLMKIKKHETITTYSLHREDKIVELIKAGYEAVGIEEVKEACKEVNSWSYLSMVVREREGAKNAISFYLLYGKPHPIKILEIAVEEKAIMKITIWKMKEEKIRGEVVISIAREDMERVMERIRNEGGLT